MKCVNRIKYQLKSLNGKYVKIDWINLVKL